MFGSQKDIDIILGRPINKKFVEAFLTYASSRRNILFILCEENLSGNEFKFKFQNKYLSKIKTNTCEVINIPTANHEFHSLKAQDILINTIRNWLKK
jgi:hypothetical protein